MDIYAGQGSPVVAVNDGVVKKIGSSPTEGRYVVLQDVYGNQYTYSRLGSLQHVYPVPKQSSKPPTASPLKTIGANARRADPAPSAPASAGTHAPSTPTPTPPIAYRSRLFAHPLRPVARRAGGLAQVFERQTTGQAYSTFDSYFARGVIQLSPKNADLRPLREGSRVIGGTILGRVGGSSAKQASHVGFQIQPAGKGAPKIDPGPVLDGWKLLASTDIYRAGGKDALAPSSSFSIGIPRGGQWDRLVQHLDSLPNPTVPTKPSKFALPARGHG
jgi:hypothetical protein